MTGKEVVQALWALPYDKRANGLYEEYEAGELVEEEFILYLFESTDPAIKRKYVWFTEDADGWCVITGGHPNGDSEAIAESINPELRHLQKKTDVTLPEILKKVKEYLGECHESTGSHSR